MELNFKPFGDAVSAGFAALAKSAPSLYVVDIGDTDLMALYLSAFPAGSNPKFRERTEHDCSTCRHFIKNLGGVVAIEGGKIVTAWDRPAGDPVYHTVAKVMADFLRSRPIAGLFYTTANHAKFGKAHSYDDKTKLRWDHFHGEVPGRFVQHANNIGETRNAAKASVDVMRRALDELPLFAVDTVIELIDDGLYRGAEHRSAVKGFRDLHTAYPRGASAVDKSVWLWANHKLPGARIGNTVIGTLLYDVATSDDADAAVRAYEAKVAPANYQRPKSAITTSMIKKADEQLAELGLHASLARRHARFSDVSVTNVLFVDNSVRGQMKDAGSLMGILAADAVPQVVTIPKPTPMAAEEFFTKILPKAQTVKLLVDPRHSGNFMSLTAPVDATAPPLFKWDNGFAWSYTGGVADSIRERVKAAGGSVSGVVRVSLSWFNYDDLDLHVKEPDGSYVFYGNKRGRSVTLDVDMNAGRGVTRTPVENLAWSSLITGTYLVEVNQFSPRESIDTGFELEYEHGGETRLFRYDKPIPHNVSIKALEIVVKQGVVTCKPLDVTEGPRPGVVKWGVTTGTLVPVDSIILSPNHWGDNPVGNKHYFFILKGCKNPDNVRTVYNEFLRADLTKHRKVFEVLGGRMQCPSADEQLSGLGFSTTQRDTITAVVTGKGINIAVEIRF